MSATESTAVSDQKQPGSRVPKALRWLWQVLKRVWKRVPAVEISAPALVAVITSIIALRMQLLIASVKASIGFDEGYTAAMGVRMLEGHWLPYVDGVSHRGPLLYWATATSLSLTDKYSWDGLRWLALGAFTLTLLGLFAAGFVARRPVAGVVAGLVYTYAICSVLNPADGVAIRGEQLAAPFSVWALVCVAFAMTRAKSQTSSLLWSFAGGVLAGCAGLSKQTLLPLMGALALWPLALALARTDWSRRRRLLTFFVPCLGWAAPLFVVFLRYAWAGELHALVYWFWRYNTEIYMAGYDGAKIHDELTNYLLFKHPWALFAAALVVTTALALSLSALFSRRRDRAARFAQRGFDYCILIGATVVTLTTIAAFRMWPHYFVVAFAWMGLGIGLSVERALLLPNRRRRTAALLIGLGLLTFLVGVAVDQRCWVFYRERNGGGWAAAENDPLCIPVKHFSKPGERIFIWGFDGDLYVSCQRSPASKYLYTTLVAGIVPPFLDKPRLEWVAEDARETLAHELETERPPVILEFTSFLKGFSMLRVPELQVIIRRDYCNLGLVRGINGRTGTLYVARVGGVCPTWKPPPEVLPAPR